MENFFVNIALPATIFLTVIAVLLFVVSLMIGIFQNVKGSVKMLITLGLLLVLFGIGYATASGANPTTIDVSANTVKMISAGIFATLALSVIAVVAAVGMSIYNAFK